MSSIDSLFDHWVMREAHGREDAPKPTLAVLFHTTSSGALAMTTTHAIRNMRSKAPLICAGRLLAPADEHRILDLLLGRERARASRLLPSHCLLAEDDAFAWWLPAEVRPMHLANPSRRWTIHTRWPTLVAKVVDRKLSVAALAEDCHPEADTPLYHAPLPNLYENTDCCTGDANLPIESSVEALEGWRSVLLDSAFTHPNWNGALAKPKKGETVETFWSARDGVTEPFPAKRLVPLRQTLAQWLLDAEGRDA